MHTRACSCENWHICERKQKETGSGWAAQWGRKIWNNPFPLAQMPGRHRCLVTTRAHTACNVHVYTLLSFVYTRTYLTCSKCSVLVNFFLCKFFFYYYFLACVASQVDERDIATTKFKQTAFHIFRKIAFFILTRGYSHVNAFHSHHFPNNLYTKDGAIQWTSLYLFQKR